MKMEAIFLMNQSNRNPNEKGKENKSHKNYYKADKKQSFTPNKKGSQKFQYRNNHKPKKTFEKPAEPKFPVKIINLSKISVFVRFYVFKLYNAVAIVYSITSNSKNRRKINCFHSSLNSF